MTIICGVDSFVCIKDKNNKLYIYSSLLDYKSFLEDSFEKCKAKNLFFKESVFFLFSTSIKIKTFQIPQTNQI